MKYYCIFAINKQNHNDILGVTEGSFSMPLSRDRVCLWQSPDKDSNFISISHKEFFKRRTRKDNSNRLQYGWNYDEAINIKGRKRVQRKLFSNPAYKCYHACGRTANEYEWHWVNHYAKGVLTCPEGYEFIICRANSKYCPVKVDTSVREGMLKKIIKYDKYDFRNAKFELKNFNDR